MIQIEPSAMDVLHPRITVIGVGGGGGNAVARMIAGDAPGINFILANTDAQALNLSTSGQRIQLGRVETEGLGAGSLAAVGQAAAEESLDDINLAIDGAHMCFIAAGMGGGTGTGAAPVIAKAARAKGILTVAVVTTPFEFEGSRRARAALAGIEELQKHVDTLIVIPNQNLFRVANPQTTFKEAFELADDVLQQGVRGITDLMIMPGLVNLDFADVRSVMGAMGKAMMGSGEASGPNRALEAAELAICNPLLDGAIDGARGIIISITGGEDMRLMEIDEAANHIRNLIDPEADIIWGSAINPEFEGRMRVSIVATGLDLESMPAQPKPYSPPDRQQQSLPFLLAPRHVAIGAMVPVAPEAARGLAVTKPAFVPSTPARAPEEFVHTVATRLERLPQSSPDDLVEHSIHVSSEDHEAAHPHVSAADLLGSHSTGGEAKSKVVSRTRGSSLFERMTQIVNNAVGHDPRSALRSATSALDAPGVYNRRGRTISAGKSPRPAARLIGVRASEGIAAMQSYPGWEVASAGKVRAQTPVSA